MIVSIRKITFFGFISKNKNSLGYLIVRNEYKQEKKILSKICFFLIEI